MNDIGALRQVFIDILFAHLHGFKFFCLWQPCSLVVANRRNVTFGLITHFNTTPFTIADKSGNIHTETFDMFVTKLDQYPIILEIFWFRRHSPHIRFDQNIVTFIPPSVFRITVLSVGPLQSMAPDLNSTFPFIIWPRTVKLFIFPASMNSFLTLTPVSCPTIVFILVCRHLLLRLWEISALASLLIAVLILVPAHRLHHCPRPCLCQSLQFCPHPVRPPLVLLLLKLALLELVISLILVIVLISMTTSEQYIKNFLGLNIGFHLPSPFVSRKSLLDCQLWTFQWLALRLSTFLCKKLPWLKIYKSLVS